MSVNEQEFRDIFKREAPEISEDLVTAMWDARTRHEPLHEHTVMTLAHAARWIVVRGYTIDELRAMKTLLEFL